MLKKLQYDCFELKSLESKCIHWYAIPNQCDFFEKQKEIFLNSALLALMFLSLR